jgi:hypothetical protein
MSWHIYVGSIGTGNAYGSRTLSHEVGHCLNLYHVWGNSKVGETCGDDGVSDTPITRGWQSCNINGSICNPPIIENVQNYMEYAFCDRMFTRGQCDRMQASLSSGTGGRNNLWQQFNLTATGTADPYDYANRPVCAPVADFLSDRQVLCAGEDSVRFIDHSWKGKPTSWSWSFPGGNPRSSGDSIPWVKYSTPGTYSVTLTVGNSGGSSTPFTRTGFIRVVDSAPVSVPITEDFEGTPFPAANAA